MRRGGEDGEHLGEATVAAFLDGRLAAGERSEAEAHIDACTPCRELISALASASSTFPGVPASEDEPEAMSSRLTIGEVVAGRFVVERRAGRGGMAHVHRARDLETGTFVALKTLHVTSDPSLAWRFEREARVLEELRCDEVVRYVASGTTADGHAWLAMEWLEGDDLSVRLAAGPLPVAQTLTLMRRIGSGLAAAHARGIVHRDVKPSNVLLRGGDVAQATLIDFGIARAPRAGTAATRRHTFLGTPGYMAPEQARGAVILDARADVFSLACVAYEAVTGVRPFSGGDFLETVAKVLVEIPPLASTRAPDAPPALDALLARMLSKAPEERPADGAAVLTALDLVEATAAGTASGTALREDSRVPGRKRGRAHVAALAAAGLVGLSAAFVMVGRARTRDHGAPIAAATGAAAAAAAGTARADAAAAAAPTSGNAVVLVLGFENHTVHVELDGTVDEPFAAAIYTSNSVDSFAGPYVRDRVTSVLPDVDRLDEAAARKVAAVDHRRVVTVRGEVANRGGGYELDVMARDATSDAVLLQTRDAAPDAASLVRAFSDRSCELRRILHDEDPTCSSRMSPVLAADHEFVLAEGLENNGQLADAIAHARRAVELDASFSKARLLLAAVLKDNGELDESLRQFDALVPHLASMSERAQLIVRLDSASLRGDYAEVVKLASAQLKKTPDSDALEARLANAYGQLGDWNTALEVSRRAAREHPQLATARANLVSTELWAGDLAAARRDGDLLLHDLREVSDAGYVYLGVVDALLDDDAATAATLAALDKQSPILAATLAADIATAHGAGTSAIARLEQALAAPGKRDREEAGGALALLAELKAHKGDAAGALEALHQAAGAESEHTLLSVARVYLALGLPREAAAIARTLRARSAPMARMAGECVLAEIAAAKSDRKGQMDHARSAIAERNAWPAKLELGKAQLAAGDLAAARATLQSCADRRWEGALPFDDFFSDLRGVAWLDAWIRGQAAGSAAR